MRNIKSKKITKSWFESAKFGMFIHWGIYSHFGGMYRGQEPDGWANSEYIWKTFKISDEEYEQAGREFNPAKFNASEWISLAKAAGMTYFTITSKHHDGYAIYNSEIIDFCLGKMTPFGRDPLLELSQACEKQGIHFCTYYSVLDWHHPTASRDATIRKDGSIKNSFKDAKRYANDVLIPMCDELIDKYDSDLLWFDGGWAWGPCIGRKVYKHLKTKKKSLVINDRLTFFGSSYNRLGRLRWGDYLTPEGWIPKEYPGHKWESCLNVNDHWGYTSFDNNYKSAGHIIWLLSDIISKGGSLLLNFGPMGDGSFNDVSKQILREIAEWMKKYKHVIDYGAMCESKPSQDQVRFLICNKKDRVFAVLKNHEIENITLPKSFTRCPRHISIFGDENNVEWEVIASSHKEKKYKGIRIRIKVARIEDHDKDWPIPLEIIFKKDQ